jgi:hypothetical protein
MDETEPARKRVWSLRVVEEDPAAESVPAWEMIEPGRYMPRRIRGSFPGRELG